MEGVAKRWIICAGLVLLSGCAQNPFAQNPIAMQSQISTLQQQQQALADQNKTLQTRATDLDRTNQELETQLAQSRQQMQVMDDQVRALREQLTSTANQLAKVRDENDVTQRKAATLAASSNKRAAASISANNSFRQNLPAVNIPGVEVRADGALVRIELPAAKMFEPGTARLRADASQLLDGVIAEVQRAYPEQTVGVEGHTDNQPPPAGRWANNHQLSVGRAMAIYDYLVARGKLRPTQLFLVGHGDNHPVVSNATSAGRERNQRVELVVYPDRAAAGR